MLFWRFFISFILMGFFIYFFHSSEFDSRNLVSFETFCLSVCYAVSTSCCFFASQRLGIGRAMSIFFIFPIFNVFFSWIYNKQVVSLHIILAVLLSLIGVYIISPMNKAGNLNYLGAIFSLIAGFSFALYLFLTKRYAKLSSSNAACSTLSIFFGNSILFFLLSVFNGDITQPGNFKIWGDTLVLAIISTIIPTLLMLYAMKKISSTKIAITSVFEPIFAIAIGHLILSETIKPSQQIGIVVIILASLIIQIDKSSQDV